MTRTDASENGDDVSPTMAARILRAAARALTVVVALMMACSLLGFLARVWWPLELMCHFRVQYAGIFLAAALLMAMSRRWRWAAACAVVGLVNGVVILPYLLAVTPARSNNVETMRVVLINVQSSNRHTDRVLKAVKELQGDVVVLVEVTPHWINELDGLTSDYPYHRTEPEFHGAGVAVYSRWPLEDVRVAKIGDTEVPAIMATIDSPGGTFSLVAAHPISPMAPTRAAQRDRQLADLALLAGKQPHPVLLVGDLNITPWSPYFGDMLREGSLRDARLGFGIQPTWPQQFHFSLLRIPIDHCLVGEDVGVARFFLGPPTGSDHLPIVVDCWVEEIESP